MTTKKNHLAKLAPVVVAAGILAVSAANAQASATLGGSSAPAGAGVGQCGQLSIGASGPLANDKQTHAPTIGAVQIDGISSSCSGWTFKVQAGGETGILSDASGVAVPGSHKLVLKLAEPVEVAELTSWSVTAIK